MTMDAPFTERTLWLDRARALEPAVAQWRDAGEQRRHMPDELFQVIRDAGISFKRVINRHSYLRQFAPALIKHITFQADPQDDASGDLIDAVALLDRMNDEGRYVLPEDAPTGFIPKKLHPFVFQDGKPHKPAWECALLTVLRDQVKSGNLYVSHSKRFASLDTFFIPEAEWVSRREAFFSRAGLPLSPEEVAAYLTARLNRAYDRFLERLPDNHYAQLDEEGWRISSDPAEKLDDGTDTTLNPLKAWLASPSARSNCRTC